MAIFWTLLNNLVWIFGKKILLNIQYNFFLGYSGLEWPGLIIESLEYEVKRVQASYAIWKSRWKNAVSSNMKFLLANNMRCCD